MKYHLSLFVLLCVSTFSSAMVADASTSKDTRTVAERLLPPDNLRLPPSSAMRTTSGLRYVVLQRGKSNAHPNPQSMVEIDYVGWDFKGHMFDSSLPRGEHAKFSLTDLIKGWQEGVLLMSPGDSFRFWIPGNLAYDGSPSGDTPKGKLVFDITLHTFQDSK